MGTSRKGMAMRAGRFGASLVLGAALLASVPQSASADEGGVSFWLPGFNGSLVAAPGTPGWSWIQAYYHTQPSVGGGKQLSGGGQIRVGLDVAADLAFFGPTYTFAEPVLGGQAAFSVLGLGGQMRASADAVLAGGGGGVISVNRTDTLLAFGDVFFQGTLKWNRGIHNYMTYWMTSAPVGSYNSNRLANTGIGHSAIDGGFGYTYFDPSKGHEFSYLMGLTYNFENKDTNYRNGVDFHVDWAASQFLSKQSFIGIGGYLYNQLTGDSGSGATLGPSHSRVAGIGPQIGYVFPIGEDKQGALVLKGFWEFAAQHRAEGWNAILALSITPAAHKK